MHWQMLLRQLLSQALKNDIMIRFASILCYIKSRLLEPSADRMVRTENGKGVFYDEKICMRRMRLYL